MRGIMRGLANRGKYVKRAGDHGVLSPKRGNKNYYKGKGGTKHGVHTDKGELTTTHNNKQLLTT